MTDASKRPSIASAVLGRSVHLVAWGLVQMCQPARAHAVLMRLGAWLSPIETADQIRSWSQAVGGRGTCLSRSLAVVARAPTADVVIGVTPKGKGRPFAAHAWVELDGTPLRPSDVSGACIARLPGPRSRANGL